MNNTGLCLCGMLGGLIAQLLSLLDLKNLPKSKRPDFRDYAYYLPWVIQPFLGWFLTFIYVNSSFTLNPLLAVNVGASAPLFLKSLMTSNLIEKVPANQKEIEGN